MDAKGKVLLQLLNKSK